LRAAQDAASFEERIEQIQRQWRSQLGSVRKNSSADLLIKSIAGAPVLTAGGAAALIGRSYPQANAAIERLVSAGLLSQITVGRRNRAFEAPAIVNAFTDLERQLASPDGENPHFWARPPRAAPKASALLRLNPARKPGGGQGAAQGK
jgi:hypothetical protein